MSAAVDPSTVNRYLILSEGWSAGGDKNAGIGGENLTHGEFQHVVEKGRCTRKEFLL